jgi:lysine-N-methylase
MELPVILPEIKGQRYVCENCGQGCRELVVYLTTRDKKKIDQQGWQRQLDVPPYVRFRRSYVLNHKTNGDCVFLTADNLCRIHAEHGYTEKPLSCQLFPFSLEPEGEGFRVTVRFDCPAVAKSVGGPLGQYRPDVARIASAFMAAGLPELAPSTRPVVLKDDRELSEAELEGLSSALDTWLRDADRPLLHRLVGVDNLVETLAAARLGARNAEFIELTRMLAGDLPSVVGEFDDRSLARPTDRQLRLFRQAVFVHCENVRLEDACAGLFGRLAYRFDQLKRARRLAAGAGVMPPLVRGLTGGTFDQLDAVRPSADFSGRDADLLLTRYLRARILGRTCFGHGFFDWPVLEGLRALMLTVAITGWVTRYVAVAGGRDCYTFDDLVRAIGIVDRNATRSPELGMHSARLRLRYLAQDHGLLRLLYLYRLC